MSDPLVFLPGLLSDARVFEPQIAALSRHLPITILPTGRRDTAEEAATEILEALPGKVSLCGMGLGGVIAIEMLRLAPSRIGKIALINTSAQADTPNEAAAREPKMVAAKTGRFGEIVREEFAPAFFHPSPRRTDLVVRMTEMGRTLGAEAYLRQARLMQKRKDQQAMLRKSIVPALIVCGTSDPTIPVRRHEFLAELMPKGHLALIDGAGMIPTLEQPEVVTTALRSWLNLPPL
jgi:pimeloyl-ACP methyl ester carboxylesterase